LRAEGEGEVAAEVCAPSVSLRIRSDPPSLQAGEENNLLTRKTGEVARREYAP